MEIEGPDPQRPREPRRERDADAATADIGPAATATPITIG
jgi:hypothetical protein